MRRRRRKEPIELTKVLKKVYPSRNPEAFDAARLFGWWATSMPARIVDRARPVQLRNGVLYVNAKSSAWANELHHSAPQILERIRAFAPSIRIKAIRFQAGPLPELPHPRKKPARTRVHKVDLRTLPEPVGRALAAVVDDGLRAVIADAAATSLKRNGDL